MPTPPSSKEANHGSFLSISSLPSTHRQPALQGLQNILATEIAETTFAQIVHGLPLSAVESDTYRGSIFFPQHRFPQEHTELCQGALEKTKAFGRELDYNILEFDSQLVHSFVGVPPGSRMFQTLLIELVAEAIHQLGVQLHQLHINAGHHEGLEEWTPSREDEMWWLFHPEGAPQTLFRHAWYCDYEQYPNGISDGVGFWAESRILGGVALFDRRDSSSFPDADPTAVYFHSDENKTTYRIYKLLDTQIHALMEFLSSKEAQPSCPLPILGTADNKVRVDPEEPIESTGIYRHLWERKPLGPNDGDQRLRDVADAVDWPTFAEWTASNGRALRMKRAFEDAHESSDSE